MMITTEEERVLLNLFTDRSNAVLFCVNPFYYLCFMFVFVDSLQPCGHLLRKDLPLGYLVCDFRK